MKTWVTFACALCGVIALAACGGSDAEFMDCAIGELTGTWRTHYAETDGDCGAIPDETSIFDPGAALPQGCTQMANNISDDQCRADLAWTCPTTDGAGTQSWVMVMNHVASDRLEGTATVQFDHIDGTCRSTYDVMMTRL